MEVTMDIKEMANDPVVREIMKDTATQAKMEKWAHALMSSVNAPNEPERDRAFWACGLLFNALRQIIQPRVVSKYKQEEED
jgi:hypothetical protein